MSRPETIEEAVEMWGIQAGDPGPGCSLLRQRVERIPGEGADQLQGRDNDRLRHADGAAARTDHGEHPDHPQMAADPGGETEEEAEGMKDTFRLCRECGKPVAVIERGLYRKILVDASPVDVFPDEHGEEFIRLDGSKMRAVPADRWDDDRKEAEYVFRPHRCRRKA